jgi:SAM-dependent methyltransferase
VDEPKRIVAAGYDAIAERYRDWAEADAGPRLEWLSALEAELADGADVLDLGCGAGVPVARRLPTRYRVTGVDISARQIELARENVPEATFVQGDALELELLPSRGSDGSIDPDWLGVPMYFAGDDAATSLARVRSSGFDVLHAEVVTQIEFGKEAPFLWVLARRTGS